MILPDVNVLLPALHPDAADHRLHASWLDDIVNQPGPFAVSDSVLASVVRLMTNRRVFRSPASVDVALRVADQVRSAPNAIVVNPGPRHWQLFGHLCRAIDAKANDVPDAWLAALAIEHGCTLATNDRGFGRFDGLSLTRL